MSSRTQKELPSREASAVASVKDSVIGRVVVPPRVPDGFTLFYTTIDFDGRIDDRVRAFLRPAALASCHQVHGVKVWSVAAGPLAGGVPAAGLAPTREEPTCDAMWTDQKNVALAIKVADCLPVSIIGGSVIINIHSGWRGAVAGIVARTLDAAPLDPASSIAFLGPSIRVCCFEVGEEVAAQFNDAFVDRHRAVKPHVDIPAFTVDVLTRRGIPNIVDTELCTRCERSIFHSYRRDKRSGRNLAIVVG